MIRRGGRPRTLRVAALAAALLAPLGTGAAWAAEFPELQQLVDATPTGGTLRPPPGTYAGPVRIRRRIEIDGGGRVRVDAGGRGSVIQIEADGVVLRGLQLLNSGDSHDRLDAGVQVRGSDNRVIDNVIENCLFGIDLQQSDRNEIRGNRIGGKAVSLGVRGDAIRLWYSRDNRIVGNRIENSRDVVVWYSESNLIAENAVSGGRYGLHFMYSKGNRVEANDYNGNVVGVFLMYSDGVVLRNNRIRNCQGATGMGVGFKESSNVRLEGNAILNCARGVYLDLSPYEPDTFNQFRSNRIAYNGVGVMFHNDWHSNIFQGNDFSGNFTQVAVRGGGGAVRNTWQANHWDDYRGFDRDADGEGDSAYRLYAYADRIWLQTPMAAFFRGSPLFEAIDFLDRLAPFTEPTLVVRDLHPRHRVESEGTAWAD